MYKEMQGKTRKKREKMTENVLLFFYIKKGICEKVQIFVMQIFFKQKFKKRENGLKKKYEDITMLKMEEKRNGKKKMNKDGRRKERIREF